MDDRERLHLDKMIQANNVVDVTDDVRAKRHSMKIKADVDTMLKMKQDYAVGQNKRVGLRQYVGQEM